MAKLGDVCTIQSGGTPSRAVSDYWENGQIPWVKISDIKGKHLSITEECITQTGLENSAAKIFPAGTILYTIFATLGETCILDIAACTNQAIVGIQLNTDKLCLDYLYYYLLSQKATVTSMGRGVAQNNINMRMLREMEIPIPPLDEQRRIAAILDKVTDLINKRRAQLDKLDLLIKARFVGMFGTEHEFGRWPCGKVADVADVCVGVVIKPTQYYAEEGIKAFRSLNIGPMDVKDNDWVYFSQEGHFKNKKSVIHKGDVLVVRSGAPGVACVATEQYDGCNAVDIIIARPDTSKIDPEFLAMFTNLPHGMNQIRERTGGAAQQHFNVGGYKALTLIMPPLDLQKQFAHFFEQTRKIKLTIQQSLDELGMLKQALMQDYFG